MKKIAILLTLCAVALSCSDDSGTNAPVLTDRELILANSSFDVVNDLDWATANESAQDNDALRMGEGIAVPPTCAEIDVTTGPNSGFPLVIVVDYGTSGCTHNNVTRRGVLTFTLTGPLLENGSELTIERTNYYVNSYRVDGTVEYVNTTTNPANPQWTRTISNGVLTNETGVVYTHSGTRSVRMVQGSSTPTLGDNVYEVTSGSHTITKQGGGSLDVNVVEPLVKQFACFYVSQGVLGLQGTFLDGELDFGAGACDNQAVYTHSDGQTYPVSL